MLPAEIRILAFSLCALLGSGLYRVVHAHARVYHYTARAYRLVKYRLSAFQQGMCQHDAITARVCASVGPSAAVPSYEAHTSPQWWRSPQYNSILSVPKNILIEKQKWEETGGNRKGRGEDCELGPPDV